MKDVGSGGSLSPVANGGGRLEGTKGVREKDPGSEDVWSSKRIAIDCVSKWGRGQIEQWNTYGGKCGGGGGKIGTTSVKQKRHVSPGHKGFVEARKRPRGSGKRKLKKETWGADAKKKMCTQGRSMEREGKGKKLGSKKEILLHFRDHCRKKQGLQNRHPKQKKKKRGRATAFNNGKTID